MEFRVIYLKGKEGFTLKSIIGHKLMMKMIFSITNISYKKKLKIRVVTEPSCSAFDSLEARSNSFIKLNEPNPNIILRLVS